MAKISVLIPSFKPGEYIQRCLKSLEQQTIDKNDFTVYVALNGPKQPYYDFLYEVLKDFTFSYKVAR